jgi:hypothetical protein
MLLYRPVELSQVAFSATPIRGSIEVGYFFELDGKSFVFPRPKWPRPH